MDSIRYVHNKGLPLEWHFKLLSIVRGDNVIEDLIDLTAELEAGESEVLAREEEDYLEKITLLQEEISEIKNELKACENAKEILDSHKNNEKLKGKKFVEYIELFLRKKDRYPSIDEVWEAAWDGCLEEMKNK